VVAVMAVAVVASPQKAGAKRRHTTPNAKTNNATPR